MKYVMKINSYLVLILVAALLAGCTLPKQGASVKKLPNDHIIFAPEELIEKYINQSVEDEREIIKRNWKALFRGNNARVPSGKISLLLTVDQSGDVLDATILKHETNEQDEVYGLEQLKRAIIAALGYKYEANLNANEHEYIKLVFNLDIK